MFFIGPALNGLKNLKLSSLFHEWGGECALQIAQLVRIHGLVVREVVDHVRNHFSYFYDTVESLRALALTMPHTLTTTRIRTKPYNLPSNEAAPTSSKRKE